MAAGAELEQLEDLAPFAVGLVHRRESFNLEHVEENERDRNASVAMQDSAGESVERRQPVVPESHEFTVEHAFHGKRGEFW